MNHPTARGPRYRQLPLWRDAQRFLLQVECAVRTLSCYHKYLFVSTTAAAAQATPGTSAPFHNAPDAFAMQTVRL